MSITTASILAIVLYLLTAGLLARRLTHGAAAVGEPKMALLTLGFGGIILHASVLYQGLFVAQGLNFGIFNALSAIAWLISGLILLASITRPLENLAIVILPLTSIAMLLENYLPADHILSARHSIELRYHILFSLLAYSLLSIAALQAILLFIQEHHLRTKHPGGFIRALPPLQAMEALLFQIIAAGFILLTLALITGGLYMDDIFAQHQVHKTILSIAAWGVFGILLWGRWHHGWRGRTAIRWTLSGFFTLLLAYVGVKIVLELILERT
ncbi:MAG: inner membrane protein YpjD [Gammaproteobacteria bacterium]|nr:MAG: inner membrane protein YpjD [Gammaproteobacteria bacterium]